MFGWTLLETILGDEAVELLGGFEFAPAGEDQEEGDGDLVLPDYAESRQAHRRSYG